MRTPTLARSRWLNGGSALLAALLLASASGCATLRATVSSYDVGPNGIARPQQRLREALMRADFPTAFGAREDDVLLQALSMGVSSYYALQFERSASVLDSAALMADDRITKSISKGALSLVTSDLALTYQPRRTERLFIPYYGMLAYARLEQWEDAAVEARRLSALLTQYAADRTDEERTTHATMHYLAGAVFERAGERNEAQVSYRNAQALAPVSTDSAPAAHSRGDGEVVVVLERGFVAHRTTESINVFIDSEDRDSLREHDDDRWARTASRIAEDLSFDDDRRRHRRRGHHHGDDDDDGYWLSIAFPTLRRSTHVSMTEPVVLLDGTAAKGQRISGSIDDATDSDANRERTGVIARALVRAAAKYAITKVVKDKKGDVAGTVVNIGASLMERADVRSWHLLPREITVLRLRVPAGQHQLQVAAADGSIIDLGQVTVRADRVAMATARVWNERAVPAVASR